MPTKMLAADALLSMTGSALVAHYNQLIEEHPELEYKPVFRFASSEVGQRRIAALYSSIKGAAADDGREHAVVDAVESTNEIDGAEVVPSETVEPRSETKKEERKVAAAKKKAPAKPAKKAAAEHAGGRGFPEDAKIKVLVKENPRRGAAAERFELYKTGMTVAEYSKKIGSRAEALVHLRWDVNKGHISVG